MSEQIAMTYAGTTGHSGTDTSRAQAVDKPRTGIVQRIVQRELVQAGHKGLTVAELRNLYPSLHHGRISSALTNLHRAGKIARLSEVRNRAKVYVNILAVDNRATEQPRMKPRHTVCPHCGEEVPL